MARTRLPASPRIGRSACGAEAAEAFKSGRKPSDNDDDGETTVSTIYYRKLLTFRASTPSEIVQEAQTHLQTGQGVTDVDHIGDVDTLTVGNQEGLEFLKETTDDLQQCADDRASVKGRMARLEERDRDKSEMITRLDEMIRVDRETIRGLQESVRRLEESDRRQQEMLRGRQEMLRGLQESDCRLQERIRFLESQSDSRVIARMRFISTFKRDYMPDEFDVTHTDRECIRDGNSQAHDADPIGDADLYHEGMRSDEGAFKALYGLSPTRVFHMKHHETLMDVLCAYADFAKKGEVSDTLKSLFAELVSAIDVRGNKALDAEIADPASPVCRLLRAVNVERRLLRASGGRMDI